MLRVRLAKTGFKTGLFAVEIRELRDCYVHCYVHRYVHRYVHQYCIRVPLNVTFKIQMIARTGAHEGNVLVFMISSSLLSRLSVDVTTPIVRNN